MSTVNDYKNMQEEQLTFEEKGHFLHTTQIFSPDDQWIVYDTRNDGTQIGQTCCIELVNINTKEILQLYQTKNQTEYGPGVGAVTFNPQEKKVLFIHGLQNCNENQPYGFSRRTGVVVKMDDPGHPIYLDARDVLPPFTKGALRGGTHAHTWSSDGEWVSFTYNDAIMAELEENGVDEIKDLRMVGVMAPFGPVEVEHDSSGENIDGEMFTVIVSEVTEDPVPGTDQIDRAYEDGWVGDKGYKKKNGEWQERAVAFLGDIRDSSGKKLTEVFIVDIPNDITKESAGKPLSGTKSTRPSPPEGTMQRRLTYTEDREFPGVFGPRHWLRSTPDGSKILFLMRDDKGLIQIFSISPNGGEPEKITFNDFSIETTFSISPDGNFIAYGYQNSVYVSSVERGETVLASSQMKGTKDLKSICWSNDGRMLACNRKVYEGDNDYFQIFLLEKPE